MLFGGPKLPGGGFFLVKAETLEIAKTYFEEDPFHTGGVNNYEFKELSFHDVQDCLKQWIE